MARPWITITSILLMIACGGGDAVQEQSPASPDTLVLADSIGVLMGDSCYKFAEISDIRMEPEGIVVLDGIFCRISFYDFSGLHLSSFGRSGEGPGEFSYPNRLCRLGTGDWFVFDFGDRTVTILDDSMEYICGYGMRMGMILKVSAAGDSTVVVKNLVVEFDEGEVMAGYRIQAMNAYSGEEGVVYREHVVRMGADEVDLRSRYAFFTADPAGNVYLADLESDRYRITVVSSEGDTLQTIDRGEETREAYDAEVHSIPYFPLTMPLTTDQGTSTLRISATELHPYVTSMEIDGQGNIWVRRMGLADSESWDVLSPSGELVRRVVLAADTTGGTAYYPSLHVSPWGMVATRNELEVARFYLVREK